MLLPYDAVEAFLSQRTASFKSKFFELGKPLTDCIVVTETGSKFKANFTGAYVSVDVEGRSCIFKEVYLGKFHGMRWVDEKSVLCA